MKLLWKIVNKIGVKKVARGRIYVILTIALSALIGAALWFALGRMVLPKTEWLICFVGYPAVFVGFLGGMLFLSNHEFT